VITAKELARLKLAHPLWRFQRDGHGWVTARRRGVALVSDSTGNLEAGMASTARKEGWGMNTARRA
jgi:hypothetical protein